MNAKLEALRKKDEAVAVVGLGYVGLPVTVALAKKFRVIGFDINEERVANLRRGVDHTNEVVGEALLNSDIEFTNNACRLRDAGFVIVAVPTPINEFRQPDLSAVGAACRTIGRNLRSGSIVVLESTVYPGVTEEFCAPIIEHESGMKCGDGFKMGYSPERINPGDREHTFERIVKVVSAQDDEALEVVAGVYGSVVEAGIHCAPTIRTAEAAKVIENTQRDLNIALMNELSLIFERLGIDTRAVLAAARTKWNFLPFTPGLVGGHCIGVDPYYLTFKAESVGYHPQVILSGRRVNDTMGSYVAQQTVKCLVKLGQIRQGLAVTVLGLTFKENVPDIRNTKVVDIVRELESFGLTVNVHDPLANAEDAEREYGVKLRKWDELPRASAVIIAVGHDQFRALTLDGLRPLMNDTALLVDVKGILDPSAVSAAGISYWRL